MRKLFLLYIIFFFATVAYSRQPDSLNTSEVKSYVIKSSNTKHEYSTIIAPVLSRSINARDQFNTVGQNRMGSPARAFFSSLIIPGSGQIKQKKWWRAGIFLALEATGIYLAVSNRNSALDGERSYEQFINNNWSVVEYSKWLVNYHEVNDISNPYIDDLRAEISGINTTFDNQTDWGAVTVSLLRSVERNTPYITSDQQSANNFSHVLPDYGSQQYYELVAKYFQFQGGWRDYHRFHNNRGNTGSLFNERYLIDRNGATASTFFFDAADMANAFNQDYRSSRLFASLLIVNHMISAFDSYFTYKLKHNDLQLSSSIDPAKFLALSYRFN